MFYARRVILVVVYCGAIFYLFNTVHGQSASAVTSNSDANPNNKKPDWKYWVTKLSQLTNPNKVDEDPKQFQALWSLLNIARYILCE